MNKFYNLVLVLLCLWVPGRAQVVEDTISLEAMIERAMSELDFSPVQSGIMIDKVPRYVDYAYLKYKAGIPPDSIFFPGSIFPLLYGMIDRSHVDSSPLTDIEDWWDVFEHLEANDTLKLGLIWYEYERIREDALTQDLLSFSVDRFYDVPQRPEHPYVTDTLFASALMRFKVSTTQHLIHYDTTLFFSNMVGTAPTLELNLEDGQGWQAIQPDSFLSLTLSQDSLHLIRIRLLNSTGGDWFGNTAVWKDPGNSNFGDDNPHGMREYAATPNDSITTVSGSTAYVFYNQNCPDPKLRKPLILIEGFDYDNTNNWNIIIGPQDALLELPYGAPNSTPLKDFIHDGNYDIIFVNFDDGSASIIDNAQIVKDVIREINEIKATNGSVEKNIVIGASAGGVVGKWALREMELADEDHETEIYITFDSPMRGANIPMGIQAFLKDMNTMKIFGMILADLPPGAEAKKGWDLLNKPATKELLYYHINGCGSNINCDLSAISSLHSTFYTQFQQLGDLDIPEYAIVNGAINGIFSEEFSSGAIFLDQNVFSHFFVGILTTDEFKIPYLHWIKLHVKLSALPGGINDKVYYKNFTHIVAYFPFYSYSYCEIINGTPKNYDNSPGGLREFSSGTDKTLKWNFNAFTYIPTISALSLTETDPFHPEFDLTDVPTITGSITHLRSYVGSTIASDQNDITRVNQNHITLDMITAPYLRSLITEVEGLGDFMGSLTDQYNFGQAELELDPGFPYLYKTPSIIQEDLTVSGSGKLYVNRQGILGDINNTENPDNDPNTTFSVTLGKSRCDGDPIVVTIIDDGVLHIGVDDQYWGHNIGHLIVGDEATLLIDNKGKADVEAYSIVYVRSGGALEIASGGFLDAKFGGQVILNEGSEMRVKSGGVFRITHYSSLIIEAGATLIIEDGAEIQLWDDHDPDGEARIEVRGNLQIEGDIIFSGNGFFDFYGGHQISITSNTFELTGHAPNYRLFRVNDTILNLTQNHLKFNDFKIELVDAGSVHAGNNKNVMMDAINFSGIDHTSTGLFVDGHRRIHVQDCRFEDLYDGLAIHSNNGVFPGHHTIIDRTDFISNSTGVIINEMDQAYVRHCNFEGNEESVLIGDLNQMYFLNSDFSTNTKGIVVWGDEQAQRIVVDNSIFFQNDYGLFSEGEGKFNLILRNGTTLEENTVGVQMLGGGLDPNALDYGILIMDCAKLINNDTAVIGTDIVLMIDAYTNSHTDDPDFVRRNHFECDTSTQKLFDICYELRDYDDMIPIPARGNYWSFTVPTTGWIYPWKFVRCEGYTPPNGNPFIYTGYTEEAPEGCPGRLIEKDTEFEDCILFQGTIDEIDIAAEYFEGMTHWREQIDSMAYDETGAWYAHFETIYSYDPLDTSMTDVCKYYIYTAGAFATGNLSFGTKPYHGSNNTANINPFDVYPNPFDSNEPVHLSYNSGANLELELLNVQGSVVFKRTLAISESLTTLKFPDLPAGVYVLKYINIESGESGYQILTKL